MIKGYGGSDEVIKAVVRRSGKALEEIKCKKGLLRGITMDSCTGTGEWPAGLFGAFFNVHYAAVSQERGRLRALVEKEKKVERLLRDCEAVLSSIKK